VPLSFRAETPSWSRRAPLVRRDQAEIKQMRKTAAVSDHQRTRKPLFHRHSRPADTTRQAQDRLCKQEVTGSIPVGSIRDSSRFSSQFEPVYRVAAGNRGFQGSRWPVRARSACRGRRSGAWRRESAQGSSWALRLLLSVARVPRSSEDGRWEVRGWLADLEAECDGCWTVAAG
jgi:hypothetical protein